jgi:endonuclease-3
MQPETRHNSRHWDEIFSLLQKFMEEQNKPSISLIAAQDSNPYRVLFSTIISLRTRDEVTIAASGRLFQTAPDLDSLLKTPEEKIAQLIYPASFYRNKAASIKKCAEIIFNEYNGQIPPQRDALLRLPGVGRKTANLTLNLGFGINAVCVDTHVHRISNRTGWVKTKNPDETEAELEKILPGQYWIPINEILVTYGQQVCTPISPWCSRCIITPFCQKIGITRYR